MTPSQYRALLHGEEKEKLGLLFPLLYAIIPLTYFKEESCFMDSDSSDDWPEPMRQSRLIDVSP